MKKILSLVLVLIIAMSVALPASAASAEDLTASLGDLSNIQMPSLEMPEFASLSEAFDAVADFLKLEGIMVYVTEFHLYMDDFYRELDTFLKAFGVVINGILSGVFAG